MWPHSLAERAINGRNQSKFLSHFFVVARLSFISLLAEETESAAKARNAFKIQEVKFFHISLF
jgi:hypothetical protein